MNIRITLAATLLAGTGLARADLVVVANNGLGVSSLSHTQVSRIFLGQLTQLPDGSAVVPLRVSGTEDQFSREILKKTPEQVEKYWARMIFTGKARPPREVKAGELRSTLAATAGALSYLDRSQVDSSMKVITVTAD